MGKKHKHSKDKLYKTVSELASHQSETIKQLELSKLHRRLQFDTCCLSLDKVRDKPVGLIDESNFCYVFDTNFVMRFLKKYPIHPVTGKKVLTSDLISLNFHKNPEGHYHCPVTLKPLNQFSKIVANKTTGNVYSNEAYQQLNVKANHSKDLLTDEPFTRSDIVTLQDPHLAEEKWNVKEFYHIKHGLKVSYRESDDDDSDPDDRIQNKSIKSSDIMKATLDEYQKQAKQSNELHQKLFSSGSQSNTRDSSKELDNVNSAQESDGLMSRSVTSTVMPVINSQLPAELSNEDILYPRVKKKGYVMISTNLGPINIELLCDRTPKTCHNFLQLVKRGYYDGTMFHRLIKNFMIQGGDPTGTGKGGESAWGDPFKDEFHRDLKHEGRGVLAMANSGPNTNKSQFYIILKGTWPHLDGKHTVFGYVKGGIETLDAMNELPTDKNDRPKQDIKLISIKIYQDPFKEVEDMISKEREEAELKKRKASSLVDDEKPLKRYHSGIGGYIDANSLNTDNLSIGSKETKLTKQNSEKSTKKPKSYGNFSNW